MRKVTTGLAAVVAAVLAVSAFGTQVQAKDWSASFPSGSAVPAALGGYEVTPSIDSGALSKGGWFPCGAFTAPRSKSIVMATYTSKPLTQNQVEARAYVYASAVKAQQAFGVIQKKLATCNGKDSITASDSGPNTMRRTVTSGTLTGLTVTGVQSLYVYTKLIPLPGVGKPAVNSGGSYSVLTLVNDTILVTDAGQVGKPGYTSAQKTAVVDFAFDFEESWVLAND